MSSKSTQKRRFSSDKDFNKKKVAYNDFILLKESFIELGEKYKKLKVELKSSNITFPRQVAIPLLVLSLLFSLPAQVTKASLMQ